MSDRNYDDQEDHAIEQAWNQVMATGSEPRLLRGGEGTDPKLVQEYTELLGLLPYQLTTEVPPPHLKATILARAAEAVDSPQRPQHNDVVPIGRPAARRGGSARRTMWRLAQAAVLAACLVGLGYLNATVRQQSQQIARLNDQLQASTLDQNEALRARTEMLTLRSRLDMITSVARQAYPLRTVSTGGRPSLAHGNEAMPGKKPMLGEMPGQEPEGIVYVCGMHQQWYLSLHGLEPPADGGEYHLWFMTEEGKVDGGILEVSADAAYEMESPTMPPSTRGFRVTLEKPNEPESLTILLGESPINL